MGGHVLDRFVLAAWPDWPAHGPLPEGYFRASPEVARMLEWHVSSRPYMGDGTRLFGRSVVADPDIPRGEVVFHRWRFLNGKEEP